MATTTDFNPDKIALNAMQKERMSLQHQLNELDKAIKEIKVRINGKNISIPSTDQSTQSQPGIVPSKLTIRKAILDIFDKFKRPLKMSEIQDEYGRITGVNYNIRENVRSLNNQGLVKLMKINKSNKNSYWVKDEWVNLVDGGLLDQYKFDGFDAMFNVEDLEFS